MKLSIFHFIRHLACPVSRVVWGASPVGALFAAAVLLCASPSSTAAGDGLHHFSVEVLAQPLLAITGERFTITGYPEKKGWNLASPAGPVKFDLYPSLEDEMDFKDPLNSKSYFFLHIADAVRQVDHRLVFALTETPCNLVTLLNLAAEMVVVPGMVLELSVLKSDMAGKRFPLATASQKVCTSKNTALEMAFFPEVGGFLPVLMNVGNGDTNSVTYGFSIPL